MLTTGLYKIVRDEMGLRFYVHLTSLRIASWEENRAMSFYGVCIMLIVLVSPHSFHRKLN